MKLLLSDTRITIKVTRDGKVENCTTFYTKYTFAILSTLTKKNFVATVSLPTSTFTNICSKEKSQVLYNFDDCYLMTDRKKPQGSIFSPSSCQGKWL